MSNNIVSVEIKGLSELQKALEGKGKEAKLALRIALNAGAGTVKDEMVAVAPVEAQGPSSGFLRDNIKVKVTMRRNDLAGKATIGPSKAVYPESKKGSFTLKIGGREISIANAKLTASRVARFL